MYKLTTLKGLLRVKYPDEILDRDVLENILREELGINNIKYLMEEKERSLEYDDGGTAYMSCCNQIEVLKRVFDIKDEDLE